MQPKVIHNFRRRAYWYGYKQVKIECVGTQNGEKVYQVSALDPLQNRLFLFAILCTVFMICCDMVNNFIRLSF